MKKGAPKPAKKNKEKPEGQGFASRSIYVLIFCLLCTFIVFINSALHNQLTNWDDNIYINENPLITTFNTGLLTARVNANWAPVYQLLLAVEYHLCGLAPKGYHLTSLLIHLCNVALTFFVVFKLSKKYIVAGIVALLFGIHPMHVESVAWAAAQKDVLFSFFYMAAMLTYLRYKELTGGTGYVRPAYLLLTGLFFMLSCLSKAQGETLPVILVLIDCYQDNNWTPKFVLKSAGRKIIFFAVSAVFGISAYIALKKGGALDIPMGHSIAEQMMFVCYAVIMYGVKFIWPFPLSALYLYPLKGAGGRFPLIYYLSPVMLALLAAAITGLLMWRKRKGLSNSILLFGLLFFVVNLVLVLQLKTLNFVILAERYTYISYFGLLFILANALYLFWEKSVLRNRVLVGAACCVLLVISGFASNERTGAWYDSETLWTDAINKCLPTAGYGFQMAYNNRGRAYAEQGKPDLAAADYTSAIALYPAFDYAYNNRGLIYSRLGKGDSALADYNRAIKYNPKYYAPYYNRGLLFAGQEKYEPAIASYTAAIGLNPRFSDAYNDRGLAYVRLGKTDLALADYNTAIGLNPRFVLPYYNRGLVYAAQGKRALAIADYNTALGLNPQYADVYNDRGLAYADSGMADLALADFNEAIALNPRFVLPYYNRGLTYEKQGKHSLAVTEFSAAINLNPRYAPAYTSRGFAYANLGAIDLAIADYNTAINLNPQFYLPYYNRGCAWQIKGNHELAQADFQRAMELGHQAGK